MKEKNNNQKTKTKLHKGMLLFYCSCALVLLCAFGLMTFRMVLNSQLNAKLDAIRAAGYPVTLEELNDYYPAVPDDENAALLYEKAFNLYHDFDDEIFEKDIHGKKYYKSKDLYGEEYSNKEKSFEYQVIISGQAVDPVLGEPLAGNIKAASQQFVDGNRDCINMLKQAAKLPKCRFPIDLSKDGTMALLPHLKIFRDIARLLSVATIIAAENGNKELVEQNILALLEMAHALDNEPTEISYLVRLAIQAIAVNTLERTLNIIKFDNDALKQISSALESHLDNDNRLLKRCVAGEQISSDECLIRRRDVIYI